MCLMVLGTKNFETIRKSSIGICETALFIFVGDMTIYYI